MVEASFNHQFTIILSALVIIEDKIEKNWACLLCMQYVAHHNPLSVPDAQE